VNANVTAAATNALFVNAPAGPLCWLFPELDGAAAVCDGAGDRAGVAFAAALAATAPLLLVPAGPLGRTLRRALVQQLRGSRQVRCDADRPGLEQRLTDAALAAGPGATFELQDDGALRACGDDLAANARRRAAAAATPRTPWLLPLHPESATAQLERALAAARGDAALWRAQLIPFFVTGEAPAPAAAATTRLPESWFGLLPGDDAPPPVRALARELFAGLWPDRAATYAALENCALGGFDLYLEALLGRALAVPAAPAPRRPLLLAFCGIDGSGKSSQLQALYLWLQARGLRVAVQKFYRHGVFHATTTGLARRCVGGRALHLWRLERLAKLMDSRKCLPAIERDLAQHDVVLFDRSVWTHFAAGAGRSHCDPFARELLAGLPVPHRTFLLDLPVELAEARLAARGERTIDENPYMLSRYRAHLLELAQRHGFTVLDANAPFAGNQQAIRAEVERLLA